MSSAAPADARARDAGAAGEAASSEAARNIPSGDRQMLAVVLEAAPTAVYYTDGFGRVVYGNARYRAMFELSADDVLDTWAHAIHPDDRQRMEDDWADVCRRPRPVQFEYRTLSKKGVCRSHIEHVDVMPAEHGGGLVGSIAEVTKLQAAQDAFMRLETRYRSTFEHLPVGLMHVGSSGRILRANVFAGALLGYSPDELAERTVMDISDPTDAAATLQRVRRTSTRALETSTFEKRYVHKDGHLVPTRVTLVNISNADGTFAYSLATIESLVEREAMGRELQRQREFTSAIVDNLPVAVFACDAARNVRIFNPAAMNLFGVRDASPVGRPLADAEGFPGDLHSADGATRLAVEERPLRRALNGETVRDTELVCAAPGSPGRSLLCSSAPLLDPLGETLGAVAIYQDITERKFREDLMRALSTTVTATEPQQLLDQAVGLLSRSLGTEIAFVGRVSRRNACRVTTLARREDDKLCPSTKYDLECAVWSDDSTAADVVVVTDEANKHFPGLSRVAGGQVRGLALARLRGDGGRVCGVVGIMSRQPLANAARTRNVVGLFALRLAPELERHRSGQRLADLFELAPDAMLTCDATGVVTAANQRTQNVFGWRPADLLGKKITVIVPELVISHYIRDPGETMAGPLQRSTKIIRLDLVARRDDQTEFPAGITLSPLDYDDGLTVVLSIRDLTGRIRAERAARQAHAVLDAIEDAAYVWDPESLQLTYVNEGAIKALGYSRAELLKLRTSSVDAERDDEAVRATMTPVLSGATPVARFTTMHRRKNGETFPVEVSLQVGGQTGKTSQMVAIARDISDRVRQAALLQAEITRRQSIETDLRLAQKLEAVGRLASGVAHELNTPIQYIGDSVHFLRSAFDDISRLLGLHAKVIESLPTAEPLRVEVEKAAQAVDLPFVLEEVPRAFERTLEGAERVGTIVRAMKEFAHESSGEQSPADLNRALQTTLVIARHEYKYAAAVETHFEEIPQVTCNLGELNQVFLNLLVNAAHALADAGKDASSGRIVIGTHQDGAHVEIYLEDNGCGIPADIVSKIYDPFFTTKEVGRGSGQGLALCRSIVVDRHGGTIDVVSAVGNGTRFTVRLPIAGHSSCAP